MNRGDYSVEKKTKETRAKSWQFGAIRLDPWIGGSLIAVEQRSLGTVLVASFVGDRISGPVERSS